MKVISTKILIVILIVLVIIFRLAYLDADTVAIDTLHNQDEGNYSYNVRNFVVEGTWIKDQTNFFLLTPIFSLLQLSFVKILGVHFWSFRLINALTSFGTVCLGYWFLKKEISKEAASIFSILLGFDFLYLIHNRIAMPETTQGFFFLISIILFYYSVK